MDLATVGLVFLIVLVMFGGAVAAMAIGQSLAGRCIRGSCGERLSCRDCPRRKAS